MNKKSEAAYKHIFEYIEENIFSLNGQSFMTDFELAMRNGLRSVYPRAEFNTCWFHFCQAARRKASQTTNFISYLIYHKDARQIYCKLLALPLLPANEIIESFDRLKVHALTTFPGIFVEFLTYYERQWIFKVKI